MITKYKLGVLGLGEGRSIMSGALKSDYWDLVQICDLNEQLCKDRIEEFSDLWENPSYTKSYEEMLANPEIDTIGIYTPDKLHATHIKMALLAGKDVICTKPLVLDLNDIAELDEIQKKTGKLIFVGQSSRFFESLKRQREDFLQGKHGELCAVQAHYIHDSRGWCAKKDWSHEEYFSWMYGFMIHAVDTAAWYLPDIETVYGTALLSQNSIDANIMSPDTLQFLFTDKSGVTAQVCGMYAIPSLNGDLEQQVGCTLRGTKGISRGGYQTLVYYTNFEEDGKMVSRTHDFSDMHDYYFRFEGNTHHAGEYQNYIEYFAMCKQKGETPKPDLAEGAHTLAIMEAMDISVKTGQIVKVSDILKKYNL